MAVHLEHLLLLQLELHRLGQLRLLVVTQLLLLLLILLLGLTTHLKECCLLLNVVVVVIVALVVEGCNGLAQQRRLVAVIAICATDSATTT